MTAEGVLELVKVFAGLDDDEEAAAYPFCQLAVAHISDRLYESTNSADVRLVAAAAGEAYYNYMITAVNRLNDGESIKIGDLTIKNDNVTIIKNAKKLRDALFAAAGCLIEDDSFDFEGV